jgi:hypothetical protein
MMNSELRRLGLMRRILDRVGVDLDFMMFSLSGGVTVVGQGFVPEFPS